MVETTPASLRGAALPTPLCIVIDAENGKVIGRWWGIADRPDRGPHARGAKTLGAGRHAPESATARAAQGSLSKHLLSVYDGANAAPDPRTEPLQGSTQYAIFVINKDPHVITNWPRFSSGTQDPGPPPFNKPCTTGGQPAPCVWYRSTTPEGCPATDCATEETATNARNVAQSICMRRDYCGSEGAADEFGAYAPWRVIGNGKQTRAFPSSLVVEVAAGDQMDGTCLGAGQCGHTNHYDPRLPQNDIIAHEFGHVMDIVYAGDRALDDLDLESQSVMEGLADMFAYDYDRSDATLGEEDGRVRIRWDDPASLCPFPGGVCFPAHMRDYDPTPPFDDVHYNGTILSHAYYHFVQLVGHEVAGHVLQSVPSSLSPKPSFEEVAAAFINRAHQLYDSDVGGAAASSLNQVGLCCAG